MSSLVTLRVPACLPSLGAAGSCLGLALDGWSTAQVWPAGSLPSPRASTPEETLAQQAMERVWEVAGIDGPSARVLLHNDASPASGVGSREASIAAGLVAGNELVGGPMQQVDLLALGVEGGGSSGGLAASLLGGLQMAASSDGQVAVAPVHLPLGLTLVLFLMEDASSQGDARQREGTQSAMDAWRTALLVSAMASSRLEQLASYEALQPASLYPDNPAKRLTCAGAMIGGALACLPAAGGIALAAFTRGREMTIAYEMAEAARQSGLEGAIKIAKPSIRGAYATQTLSGDR